MAIYYVNSTGWQNEARVESIRSFFADKGGVEVIQLDTLSDESMKLLTEDDVVVIGIEYSFRNQFIAQGRVLDRKTDPAKVVFALINFHEREFAHETEMADRGEMLTVKRSKAPIIKVSEPGSSLPEKFATILFEKFPHLIKACLVPASKGIVDEEDPYGAFLTKQPSRLASPVARGALRPSR